MQGVWGFSLSLSPGAPEDAYWTIHFSPPTDIRALQLLSEVTEGKVISPDILAYAVWSPQWKQDFWGALKGKQEPV